MRTVTVMVMVKMKRGRRVGCVTQIQSFSGFLLTEPEKQLWDTGQPNWANIVNDDNDNDDNDDNDKNENDDNERIQHWPWRAQLHLFASQYLKSHCFAVSCMGKHLVALHCIWSGVGWWPCLPLAVNSKSASRLASGSPLLLLHYCRVLALKEHLRKKRMFTFGHCSDHGDPCPIFEPSFRVSKIIKALLKSHIIYMILVNNLKFKIIYTTITIIMFIQPSLS